MRTYPDDFVNKIICGDCLEIMREMPDNSVDLTVTSPPYDNLRNYKGYTFEFEEIAKELYRITKVGGVLVWVVGDATIKGSETGTSFYQALFFKDICDFNLHDTMIYEKNSSSFPARKDGNRYTQIFEYMFVLSKGKPKHKLLCDKENKWAGFTNWGKNTQYDKNGKLRETGNVKPIPKTSPRTNIWKYSVGFNDKTGHPAVFPEQLANDHIISWSNEGDLVLDPMCGSGTTCKMAKLNNRDFTGIDISEEYCKIARERIGLNIKENTVFS